MHALIKVSRLTALALAASLAAGCATITQEEFDAVSATANQALNEARAAQSAADAAASQAASAMAAAQSAQQAADAAQQCCNEGKDRLERMFQERMRK